MSETFCQALQSGDRARVARVVNAFLGALDIARSRDDRLASLRDWMANQACVTDVVMESYWLDSEPPVRPFSVTYVSGAAEPHRVEIGITAPGARLMME